MFKFTFFIVLLLNSFLCISPGENQFTIQRPEGQRTYYVYLPKSYQQNSQLPLLFAFHGIGDTATNLVQATKLKDYSEVYNYILVYPQGFSGPTIEFSSMSAWNAGACCFTTSEAAQINDYEFVQQIFSDLQQNNIIYDLEKAYVTGFSNGAMMSESLGCLMSSKFRAVASVSGVVELNKTAADSLTTCDDNIKQNGRPLNILNIHGTSDELVPWNGGGVAVLIGIHFPDIPSNMQRWAQRFGCSNSTRQSLNNNSFTNQIWDQGCQDGVKIELVKNQGGVHEWPSTSDFDTTTYILNFFGLKEQSLQSQKIEIEITQNQNSQYLQLGQNSGHYGNPQTGCLSDEIEVQFKAIQGRSCMPICSGGSPCIEDPSVDYTAQPKCVLRTPTGQKVCSLFCKGITEGSCPSGANCVTFKEIYGICMYQNDQQRFLQNKQ